jgi:hypothetical protein
MLFMCFIDHRDRPSLRLRVTRVGGSMRDNAVMLSPFTSLMVNSAKQLAAHRDRPFAAAQGDRGGADFIIRIIY